MINRCKTTKIAIFRRFVVVINSWLGIANLFQTFEDLESVKDKWANIQAVRQVLDEEGENGAEVRSC